MQIVKIVNKGTADEKEEIVDTLCGTTEKRMMSAESAIPAEVKKQISGSKTKMKNVSDPELKRDYFNWITLIAETLLFKFKSGMKI